MKRIIGYLLIILLPIVIILSNFLFLEQSRTYHKFLFNKTGVYQSLGVEVTEKSYENVRNFLKDITELDENIFSRQAIRHMADVRHIFDFTRNFLYLITFASLVAASVLVATRSIKILANSIFISSLATIAFILSLTFGLIANFNFIFDKLHRIIFTDNLWLFPKDDFLVALFPQQFFVAFANQLTVNILLTAAILAGISYKFRKKPK